MRIHNLAYYSWSWFDDTFDSIWTKYTVAGPLIPPCFIHQPFWFIISYPRFIRLHDVVPSPVCRRRASYWVLERVSGHRTPVVDRCSILPHALARPDRLSLAWFRLEIVRFFLLYSFVTLYSRQIMTLSLYLLACLVIAGPICLHLITLHRSCRSTIFPIIVLGRSSTSPFGSRATLFELLNHLQRFQKAIKKVRAVQRMRRNRGFAFSQTEDPSRPQDQARLIRAYDTSKSNARPSGY